MKNLHIGGIVIPVPIIQGGMGVGISLSGLASAVADQGGVGVMSAAGLGLLYRHLSSDYPESCILGLREEIKKAREKTKGIIGVNIMVAMTNFADMVKTSLAEKVDIIYLCYPNNPTGTTLTKEQLAVWVKYAKENNAACKALFDRLVANGKNKKSAVIAVCNKLLKQVFGCIKNQSLYQDNYLKNIA